MAGPVGIYIPRSLPKYVQSLGHLTETLPPHMTEQTYPHKRGATLSLAGTVTLPAGTWSASAQVRNASGSLVQQLTVTLQPPVSPATAHSILIEAPAAQTEAWPLTDLRCDVRFVDASVTPVVVPSPTFVIKVQQEVTHAV